MKPANASLHACRANTARDLPPTNSQHPVWPHVSLRNRGAQLCQARNVRSARVLSAPQRQGRGRDMRSPALQPVSAIRNHAETSAHLANGRLVPGQPKLTNPACAGEARSNCVPLIFRSRRTRRPRRRARRRGISAPFEVQAATIPDILAGRDVCGARPPARARRRVRHPSFARIGQAAPKKPKALILAPTREPRRRSSRELEPLARVQGRSVYAVYGGVGYDPQRRALRKGVDVLVACPGRS